MNIYKNNIFKYIVIIFLLFIIFKKKEISLRLIFWLILSISIIYFYKEYDEKINNKNEKIIDDKKEIINDNYYNLEDNDIINFLYGINDFKFYNEELYNDLIENIQYFLYVYESNVFTIKQFDILEMSKIIIINLISSFIYTIPTHKEFQDKLHVSKEELLNILTKKINIFKSKIKDNKLIINDDNYPKGVIAENLLFKSKLTNEIIENFNIIN